MRMTKAQAINLARLIESIRTEWGFHGVMAALGKVTDRSDDPAVIAIAALTCAQDVDANTPAAVVNDVYWPAWSPASPAEDRYRAHTRSQQIASQRVLADIRAIHETEYSRAGYLAAVAALNQPKEERA